MDNFSLEKQTENLIKATTSSVKALFPVIGREKTLKLTNIWAEDNLDPEDYRGQRKAKVGDRTWGVPIYGSFEIADKSGKVVEKKAKVRLATLPKPTPRFSFIIKGGEHQIANQLRLRPAGYTVRSQNGGVRGQINLSKGYAGQIGLTANPETGLFRINIGQAKQRLYPVLNAIGVSDKELSKKWGEDVLEANKTMKRSDFDAAIRSFAKSVTGKTFNNTETASQSIRDFIKTTKMDPDINKRTLGAKHDKMDGGFLTDISTNLLDVMKGKAEAHDRNALEFKEFRSLQNLIEERLSMPVFKKKIVKAIQNNLNSTSREGIENIVNSSIINPHIGAVFNLSELHQLPKQLNPINMLNSSNLVTIMGPGGINDRHTITEDMRDVHPSHLGFIDPVHTPESDKVGAVYHLPVGVDAKNKTLLTRAINTRTGKLERIDPAQFADSVVAFPGQLDPKTKKWTSPKRVIVLGKGNKTTTVGSKDVDYILQSPKQVFSMASNLIPFLPTNNPSRALISSKLAEQAVSLKYREKPLVQSKIGGKVTFEDLLGDAFSFRSPVDGIITKVTKDQILVKDNKGKVHDINMYENFPLNQKSFIDSRISTKKGDIVKKGQILADTNFTQDGVLAIGKNLNTAYIPYKGYNFEDGIVITDEASKKLTSEHMHINSTIRNDNIVVDLDKFIAHYPGSYSKSQVSSVGKDGIVKKGTVLQPGDPVITRLRKNEVDPENLVFGKLARSLVKPWKDESIKWTGDTPGKVVDIVHKGKHTKVYIRTEEQAKIGDKLVGRFGNKGIITKIIPEEMAPKTKAGEPVDIMYNPHGIVTRINIGQVLENVAGKVADKMGKPYVVDNFSNENYTQTIKDLAKKHGVSGTEELIDPESGKSLGQVAFGKTYVLKLDKQAKAQFSARGAGPGWKYNQSTQEPVKGGEPGSKAVDLLMFYSMLAHGAKENLREMATYKASRNDEFWYALKTGGILPPPKPTFAYNKFVSYMKGAGVDIKQDGTKLTLAPLTDASINKMTNGPILNPQFVRAKDLSEIKGGLMDRHITGGLNGTKWSHIELAEPIVNPIFEAPVRALLGMDKKTFKGLTEGELFLNDQGDIGEEGTLTAGKAFEKLLKGIDKAKMLRKFKSDAKKTRSPSSLNKANQGIRYVEALNKFNLEPAEAYIMKKAPVLPPIYRPIYALPDGNLHTSPVNFLYRDLGLVSQKLKWANSIPYMPEDAKVNMRKGLYNGMAAVSGLSGTPITFYPKSRRPRGLIEEIKGSADAGSKSGFFQRHVLRREQDLVGRGTIIPEPKLGIDEAGIPEEMAWTMFQPFTMKKLIDQGYKAHEADKEIEDRSFVATKALEAAMRERPVFLNRAPSLHKFSVMAFKPQMVEGKAIKIPPLIVKGFNADFDGNCFIGETTVFLVAPKSFLRFIGKSNITEEESLAVSNDSTLETIRTRMDRIPYVEGTGRKDKNGATVYRLPDGVSVLSYNHETNSPSMEIVTDITIEESCECRRVSTRRFNVTASSNESMCVYDNETGEIRRISPDESIGRLSPVIKKTPASTTSTTDDRDIVPIPIPIISALSSKSGPCETKTRKSLASSKSKRKSSPYITRTIAEKLVPMLNKIDVPDSIKTSWSNLVSSKDVMWDVVEKVEDVGNHRVFDLVVPSTKVFSVNGGLVVWDTMHVHVPVMPKAVEEAQKMFPSKNLFNPGTGGIMMAPSQESAIGLYFLSKNGKRVPKNFATTDAVKKSLDDGDIDIDDMVRVAGKNTSAGRVLIDAVLPKEYQGRNKVLDKKSVSGLLSEIANKSPSDYAKTVDSLTELGNKYAFQKGFTVSINDVQPHIDGKKQLMDAARKAAEGLSDDDTVKLYKTVDKKLKGLIKNSLGKQGNNLYQMVLSGARGNMDQLKQIVSAPLLVDDVHGKTLPIPIEGSYSQGLPLTDYWNSLYGSRKGVIDKLLQTSKPGEFNKDLMATMVKNSVLADNCETAGGVHFDIDDPDTKDRILAEDVKRGRSTLAKSGDVVTGNLLRKLRSSKVKTVKCKSPLTCGMSEGSCATCYGVDETGHLPPIGTNIGAIAGQAMTEPLTQMVLGSMHSGGVSSSSNVTGYEKIDKLVKMPQVIVGKATLSNIDGKITGIEAAPAGGKNVFVSGEKHFVSEGNPLKVKVGSSISKGDPISEGIIQPREIVKLKGMLATQKYLVDEITDAYRNVGVPILKRNVETVVQSLTNTTRVVDGGSSPYKGGDVIPYNLAENYNKKALGEVSPKDAIGKALHRGYGTFSKGTVVDKRIANIIEGLGHTKVSIGPEPIIHKPFVDGVKQLPLLSRDWMSQLGYGHIVRGIQQGASEAWSSDIHGHSPIPAFAYGAEFGKGKGGKY